MIKELLFGLGLVAVVEGLVLALCRLRLEEMLMRCTLAPGSAGFSGSPPSPRRGTVWLAQW